MFITRTGKPVGPDWLTRLFRRLVAESGLPPVTLHGLRHGAATLGLAAGHDMKVVQDTLGLSSITIAADTYTSVLPQLARQSAEDVAALIRPAGTPRTAPPSPPRRSTPRDPATRETAPPGQQQPPAVNPSPPFLPLSTRADPATAGFHHYREIPRTRKGTQ